MGASYGTIEGLYRHGLPRGSLTSPARLIASADPTTNRLELEGHALGDGAALLLTVDDGGVLPAPLSTLTIYRAKLVELESGVYSESLFEVALTEGGAAIDLTDEGTAPFRLHLSFIPTALRELEIQSRWLDSKAKGHVVPFEAPYPAWVVALVEQRAAIRTRWHLGRMNQADAITALDFVTKEALPLMQGAPLRDETATAPANQARGASPTAATGTDDWSVLP